MADKSEIIKQRLDADYQFIINLLKNGEAITGKDVAREARKVGLDWAREHANSRLYTLWRNGSLLKVETSKAPLWTLPEFSDKHKDAIDGKRTLNVVYAKKNLPLVADESMTISILDVVIEFAFNDEMTVNDPYMYGDWLESKIFVSLNRTHPYWNTFIHSEVEASIQITNIALEVYVQWYVAKMQAKVTPQKLLEIRDKAMRDIALK